MTLNQTLELVLTEYVLSFMMTMIIGRLSSTNAKGPCFSSPAKIPIKFKFLLANVNINQPVDTMIDKSSMELF